MYNIFDPKVDRPLHELPREEALKAYDLFLESIPLRLEELSNLVSQDGIELDFSESSLAVLHEWFFAIAREEHMAGNIAPSSVLFSISNDIGIYLAEMLRAEGKTLRWNLYTTNPKGLSYQRPVITGFKVKNEDYHVDFDYLICQYAFRVLKTGKKEDNLFLSMFRKGKEMLK